MAISRLPVCIVTRPVRSTPRLDYSSIQLNSLTVSSSVLIFRCSALFTYIIHVHVKPALNVIRRTCFVLL